MHQSILDAVRALRSEPHNPAERPGEGKKTKARLMSFLRGEHHPAPLGRGGAVPRPPRGSRRRGDDRFPGGHGRPAAGVGRRTPVRARAVYFSPGRP